MSLLRNYWITVIVISTITIVYYLFSVAAIIAYGSGLLLMVIGIPLITYNMYCIKRVSYLTELSNKNPVNEYNSILEILNDKPYASNVINDMNDLLQQYNEEKIDKVKYILELDKIRYRIGNSSTTYVILPKYTKNYLSSFGCWPWCSINN